MCYSAEVYAAYDKFVRLFGATMSVREFYEILYRRSHDPEAKIKVPKAMEPAFEHPATDAELEIKEFVDKFNTAEATPVERELFAQRKRLADAERTLVTKTTKAEAKRALPDVMRGGDVVVLASLGTSLCVQQACAKAPVIRAVQA